MKNFYCFFAVILSIISITYFFLTHYTENVPYEYLESIGIDANPNPIEHIFFTIPTEFDDVYLNYNELQKEAGFDLSPYKGKTAERYTFLLKNNLRANVIVINNAVVGGDISSIALDGYMQPLCKAK